MEQNNIAERFHKAIEDSKYSKKRSHLIFLILLLLMGLVIYDIYSNFGQGRKLKQENTQLRSLAAEQRKALQDLTSQQNVTLTELMQLKTQLAPFEKAAQQKYPDESEAIALSRLLEDLNKQQAEIFGLGEISGTQKKEIRSLRKVNSAQIKEISHLKGRLEYLEDEKRFRDVALWTMDGQIKLWNGQFVDSPVAGWSDKNMQGDDESLTGWRCGSQDLLRYHDIVEQFPNYPFPYYVLARCLKTKAQSSWKDYARKGIAILEKTTNIPGHVSDHDHALAEMQKLLKEPS